MNDNFKNTFNEEPVRWYGYFALIVAILFFSGIFTSFTGPLRALDFTNLAGDFGVLGMLGEGAGKLASNFRGINGSGAKDGFMFGLTLCPAVMFAIGAVKVLENYDGLRAAQNLLTPLLRPLLGISGICGLALIASLQSADAGASMTKELFESGRITERERIIFCAFQFSGGAPITNYLSSGSALFPFLIVAMSIPLATTLVFKVIGANLVRLYLSITMKEGK